MSLARKLLLCGALAAVMVLASTTLALAAPPTIPVGVGIPNAQHSTYPGYCLSCHPGFAVSPPALKYGTTTPTHASRGPTCTQCHVVLPNPVSRLAGQTRFDTAVEISKKGFPGTAPAVVVAPGMRWQEPLVASSLCGSVGGPLLLTNTTSLAVNTANEIKRLQPATIYVVGDLTAIDAPTFAAISAAYPTATITRIAGADAYGTSLEVAKRVKTAGSGGTVFLARGDTDKFADALAASSLAAKMKAPIVLTEPTALTPAAASTVSWIQPSRIVVCGGTAAVADVVMNGAKALAPVTATTTRVAGASRYDTATQLASFGVAEMGAPSTAYLAYGLNFPDALGGGVLAGIATAGHWQPVLLTAQAPLSAQVPAFLTANRSVTKAVLLGGTAAIPATIEAPVLNALP